MSYWQALILGFVQGITEFLPISSSGHLVIIQNWLQINPPPIDFDLFLHLVSLIVIIYFFRNILRSINRQMIVSLFLATIPLGIVGLLLKDSLELIYETNIVVGFGLIFTGLLNFRAAKLFLEKNLSSSISNQDALKIGFFQALATIPGVSRSGSTLFGASLCKVSKNKAFEFSFLLAIIAILLSNIGQILLSSDCSIHSLLNHHWTIYLAGGATCFIFSLVGLKLVKATLDNAKYHFFGWYCIIIGFLTILLSLF